MMQDSNQDLQLQLQFLNDNLISYFGKKPYSLRGIKTRCDTKGEPYKTYSFFIEEIVPQDVNLNWTLRDACKQVSKIINGLIRAKAVEKPECQPVAVRGVEVHWRKLPTITWRCDDHLHISSIKIMRAKVEFRVTVQHKL